MVPACEGGKPSTSRATLFDGRPVVFDEEDFPAIAVYLTDAEYTGEELDADTVSDNRRRFIFCKYCYDTQVHPPYGVNCV